MERMKITAGHQVVMPHLTLKGALKFSEFAAQIFGAIELFKVMRDEELIMHSEIKIGESVIMLADATDEFPVSNGSFYIYVSNVDDTFKKALDAGATSLMEPFEEQYGARAAGLKDPFGNTWWLSMLH